MDVLYSDEHASSLSRRFKASPVFELGLKMLKDGSKYNGDMHLELSKYYEEKGDVKKSWQFLESAGFWCGKKNKKSQPEMLDAAIRLCKKK